MKSIKTAVSRLTAMISAFAVICFISSFAPLKTNGNEVSQEDLFALSKEMALLINEARAEYGLPPLYVVPYLCDKAADRARECIESFDHKRPDGTKYYTIIRNEHENVVNFTYSAENIAAGSPTAEATFNQWKSSTMGHWEAILSPKTTHMGVGVAYEPNSQYGWYWETLFIQTGDTCDGQYLPVRYEIVPESSGDLNGDANVDTFDYVVLLGYIEKTMAGKPVYLNDLQLEAADCFKDGVINENDAKALQRYILGEYKVLPYEF